MADMNVGRLVQAAPRESVIRVRMDRHHLMSGSSFSMVPVALPMALRPW